MIAPPPWTAAALDKARQQSEDYFRQGRHTEPLDLYLEYFDEYQGLIEEVMEETVDLSQIHGNLISLFSDTRKQEIVRYLSGPPVSEDDLKTLLQAKSLAPKRLAEDPVLLDAIAAFIRDWHDRRRFPWVTLRTEPSEHERKAAVLATSALLAMRRLETMRRSEGKQLQEKMVETQLRRSQFQSVPTRRIHTLNDAPKPGEFCRESYLGTRKADFVIGLWDGRTMPLECKVSNSSTNSVKRLNNDAAVKAETWKSDFGTVSVVPAAVLSGVYKLSNLQDALNRGLAIFWVHELQTLVDWIHKTKSPPT